jgi:hypothetical protein
MGVGSADRERDDAKRPEINAKAVILATKHLGSNVLCGSNGFIDNIRSFQELASKSDGASRAKHQTFSQDQSRR